MHSIPGGPWDQGKQALPAEVKQNILRQYGLDRPLMVQYGYFWKNLAEGNLGVPYQAPSETVVGLITHAWVPSAQLGGMAFLLAVVVGVPLGVIAGIKQNTWIDQLTTATAALGYVLPNFVTAIVLIWLFAVRERVLPPGGWDSPKHWIMPVIAFSLSPMAIIARYTRSAIVDVLHNEYIRTANAKGLRRSQVAVRHILRPALIPMITVMGPMAGALVTGSIFIESIFRIPGLGRFFAQSVFNRDYPMIMGLTLFFATLVAFAYLITDLLYLAVDPRISFKGNRRWVPAVWAIG
jgi:ABC-type dipeptide/oligopeptide/nickel transport system permease component